jgi:hypothetical protein
VELQWQKIFILLGFTFFISQTRLWPIASIRYQRLGFRRFPYVAIYSGTTPAATRCSLLRFAGFERPLTKLLLRRDKIIIDGDHVGEQRRSALGGINLQLQFQNETETPFSCNKLSISLKSEI